MSRFKDVAQQKESIKACVRIRPVLNSPEEKVFFLQDIQTIVARSGAKFSFNHVFDDKSSTDLVYDVAAKPIIQQSLRGFNGCILAYGQTSSGKTHTMKGTNEEPGIVLLALADLFDAINKNDLATKVEVSYMEIYNEKIYDLLSDSEGSEVQIQNNQNTLIFTNLRNYKVSTFQKAIQFFYKGEDKRKFASNNLNLNSSRSHTIFRISVTVCSQNFDELRGQIDLVDLAGSESLEKTKNQKISRVEGENINKSLLALSKIITLLSEKKNDAPVVFRDSKLTRILQRSLCQNSKSSIICMINPTESNFQESLNTLKFGQNALKIKILAKQNINRTNEEEVRQPYLGRMSLIPNERIQLEENRQILRQNQILIKELNKRINELEIQNNKKQLKLDLAQKQLHQAQKDVKRYKQNFQTKKSEWQNQKTILSSRLKNYESEYKDLQKKYDETQRNLRQVQKNQKSLVESLAHFQKMCQTLKNQVQDIGSIVKQESEKHSRRKPEQFIKEIPQNQQNKKKGMFYVQPYVYDPNRERMDPYHLGWSYKLKAEVIDLGRKVFEYTKANAEIAQENQKLTIENKKLKDMIEDYEYLKVQEGENKKQSTGKKNPQVDKDSMIRELKRKFKWAKQQYKQDRKHIKQTNQKNVCLMLEFQQWYQKKYSGSVLVNEVTQTDFCINFMFDFQEYEKKQNQQLRIREINQKMSKSKNNNIFMAAVGSPIKSELLRNQQSPNRSSNSFMRNQNPEAQIPSGQKSHFGQGIQNSYNQRQDQNFRQSEESSFMLLNEESPPIHDSYQRTNQSHMKNGNFMPNNFTNSNVNNGNRGFLQKSEVRSGNPFTINFQSYNQHEPEEQKDLEI